MVGQVVFRDCRQPALVAGQGQQSLAAEFAFPVLDILRNIDDDRAGSPRARKLECAAHRLLELFGLRHEEYVLGDGAHDGRDRGFLERVGADSGRRHLPADDDDGNRVRHAVAHGCDRVRRARTRGDHDDTHLAACACVSRRHEAGALLVGRHDERHCGGAVVAPVRVVVAEDGVVGWQYRAARIAEDRVDAFVGEDLDDDIGAGQARARQRMPARCRPIRLFVHFPVSCKLSV